MAHYDRYLELLAQHNATGRAEDALQPLPCWDRSVARASAPKVLRYLHARGGEARRLAILLGDALAASVGRRRALAAAGAAAFRARAGAGRAAPVVAALRRRRPHGGRAAGAGAGAAAGRRPRAARAAVAVARAADASYGALSSFGRSRRGRAARARRRGYILEFRGGRDRRARVRGNSVDAVRRRRCRDADDVGLNVGRLAYKVPRQYEA